MGSSVHHLLFVFVTVTINPLTLASMKTCGTPETFNDSNRFLGEYCNHDKEFQGIVIPIIKTPTFQVYGDP